MLKKFLKQILSCLSPSFRVGRHINERLNKIDNKIETMATILTALTDTSSLGILTARMANLSVPLKYHNLFYNIKGGDICIDCGANVGKFIDAVIGMGAECYAFEPNPSLTSFLARKYKDEPRVYLYDVAVGAQDEEANFYWSADNYADESASVHVIKNIDSKEKLVKKVKVVDLCKFIQDKIGTVGKRVYLLKIDIEGAEFDLLEKIIKEQTYQYCDHIVVETHERFFNDGQQKLENIKKMITAHNISNIDLGWV